MTSTPHAELANELSRGLAAALRSVQLCAPGHPLVDRSVTALADTLARIHSTSPSIAIGVVGEQLIVGDTPVSRAAASMDTVMRQLKGVGLERIVIDQGVQPAELTQLIQTIGAARATAESTAGLSQLKHIRVGHLQLEEQGDTAVVDIAAYRRLYNDAVSVAGTLWDSAQLDGMPDPEAGRGIVDSLAEEVSLNRTALLALTALKDYDNYTFTHMVNVSILTMGQARGLGIEGPLLREFGLSALLHDIGKVKTPDDILKKPEQLTDQEFNILRRHPVEGAEILRRTPDMPRSRRSWPSNTICAWMARDTRQDCRRVRPSTWARCYAGSRTSTTRCGRNAPTRKPSRRIASWRCCSGTTAPNSTRIWCGGSCS